MALPPQSHSAWKITISIVHVLAILWTALRLHHRFKSRLWWDDAAVVIALITDVFSFIIFWVKYKGHEILWTTPLPSAGRDFLWSPWLSGFLYTSTLWFSRISLMLSLTRIFTTRPRFQKLAIGMTACFLAFYLTLNVSSALLCKSIKGQPWWIIDYTKCILVGKQHYTLNTVLTIIFDTASDIMIVVLPLSLVKTMRIRRRTRDLMVITFCGTIFTMAVSIVYFSVFMASRFHRDGLLIYVAMSHLHASTSLMIANLLVDLLVIYRFFHKSTGLSTFSDGVDSEVVTDSRAVEATQLSQRPGGGTPNSHQNPSFQSESSLGQLTLTPISTAVQTNSRATRSQGLTTSFP